MAKRKLELVKPCSSGSPEQQLDMCESGKNRGDEILHSHGADQSSGLNEPLDPNTMETNFRIDMSEENREGDEESGDEHSSGLQGDEQQELQHEQEPGESDAGLPGEMTERNVDRRGAG